ncbi:hypothetical protein Cs7R123_05860 [Catellatospora sp. TT07R-123]|uniref:hypothetical protein n=1 Tax=Catellatospora sp. TT07R-123 TaxID=2733863 RepID=UPI001B27ED67|nr:hypothetical protein [Catellatospora sp. TT07R-123]GHJ43244.1 hypothetical protein Cs7R123_05860 [Catellatospora sp. TT07R-123]
MHGGRISFCVLGPVTAEDVQRRPVALKGPMHRAVLGRLLVARGWSADGRPGRGSSGSAGRRAAHRSRSTDVRYRFVIDIATLA